MPHTNGKFSVLQEIYGEDLKIESFSMKDEWGLVSYSIYIYLKSDVDKEVNEEFTDDRIDEYDRDGIVAVLDCDSICMGKTFEEAIDEFYHYHHIKQYEKTRNTN